LTMATCTILPKDMLSETEALNQIFAPLSVNVEVREMHDYSGNDKLLLSGERKNVGAGCMFVEKDSLYINVHGNAAPCCAVYDESFYTDSITDSSATDILNSRRWLKQRHLLRLDKRKRLSFCKNCALSIRGSASEAFARTFWSERIRDDEITDKKELRYIKTSLGI
ncbi:MAG: SPASM domain-containing protein, partial [Lachnospiraceae bacterium]|nr:SPASM domain-containing protein [Lachnospiraceae bacterium]